MLKQKISFFFQRYKDKFYIGLIILLLILLANKHSSIFYLETIEEVIPKPVVTVESTDLFSESIPRVLEAGKDGLQKVVYKTEEGSTKKNRYKTEIIKKEVKQKEKIGLLKFKDYKVQIQNQISDYLLAIKKENYSKLSSFYLPLTSHNNPQISQYNYTKIFNIIGNPTIEETIPLYNYSSSYALTKTIIKGNFHNLSLDKNTSSWEIYSLWDGGQFKILNPEFISYDLKLKLQDKLIQGTNTSKSHYLGLQIRDFFINFPNKIYFSLDAKTTENVQFNKVKIKIENNKTKELYYESTVNYSDITEKAHWRRAVYKGKSGYRTNFWVPIEFNKSNFSSIYDKLFKGTMLNTEDLVISVKPVNDYNVYIYYDWYIFNLNGK